MHNFGKAALGRLGEVYLNLVKPRPKSVSRRFRGRKDKGNNAMRKQSDLECGAPMRPLILMSNKINVTYKQKEMVLN